MRGDSNQHGMRGGTRKERGREGGLLISLARATRGLKRPSPGLMARLGMPVGGAGEKIARSWRPSRPPSHEEKSSELCRRVVCGMAELGKCTGSLFLTRGCP